MGIPFSFLLMNVKKHYPYTNNFSLNVLQLQYIDMATKEDISSNLVYWAKLFNATTWEEFKALAAGNADIEEVGNLILTLNTDDKQKELLEGQRRYREQMASQYTAGYTDAEEAYQNIIISKDATITDQANTISEQANTIADRDNTIKQLQAQIAQLKGEQ